MLTAAQRRELRSVHLFGEPSDPLDYGGAGGLWFVNRDRALGALLRRGLIQHGEDGQPDWVITRAGLEALL